MATAILNEETASLPLLLHCIVVAVARLDAQEVVESFITNGWNHRSCNSGAALIPRKRTQRVLDEFDLTENERVAINQKALGIRETGKGPTIKAGRQGAALLRTCVIRYNEALIEEKEAQLRRDRTRKHLEQQAALGTAGSPPIPEGYKESFQRTPYQPVKVEATAASPPFRPMKNPHSPIKQYQVVLPLDIMKTLLGSNIPLLKRVLDDKRISDRQFRGLVGIVLADFELVD